MLRLLPFELEKIWRKKSFLLSALVLLAVNVFLLWYTSLPTESRPPLSAYKAFQTQISTMSEEEKGKFICERKETLDGVRFVEEILGMQGMANEMGDVLAKQALDNNPGVFETYYPIYEKQDYLRFTENPEQEAALTDELYEEWQKVSEYDAYLDSVQKQKDTLSGISIFQNQSKDTFASRNIEKSAVDYARLNDAHIRWTPAKAITLSMENSWTDILLFLSVFLFVGNLILEEKAKKLFYITRSTKRGIVPSILARLLSLCISCMLLTALFYTVNLVFSGCAAGISNLNAGVQSLAPYLESSLSIRIWEYLVLSIFTKGLVFFGIGALLTALCILADNLLLPFLAGFALWGISFALYTLLPAGSAVSIVKYWNMAGFLKTEKLYGGYLNFNLFGFPASRLILSQLSILLLAAAGIGLCLCFFARTQNLELKRLRITPPAWMGQKASSKGTGRKASGERTDRKASDKRTSNFSGKTHGSLFLHECYKILIAGGALPALLLFALLLGDRTLKRTYQPSSAEQYYQTVMLQLEGPLTDEKKALVLSEQEKYEEAFAQIEQIEQMVSDGKLSPSAGESLKTKWYTVTAFYPAFTRIWNQYQNIGKNGGSFVYDTSWLYLFGKMDDGFLIDFLLISLCIVLSFSNAVPMEYQSGALQLISTTKKGRKKVLVHKILVCTLCAALLSLLTFLCRGIRISSVYPLHELGGSIKTIPYFRDFPLKLPVGVFAALLLLLQMTSSMLTSFAVLLIGRWRKNHVQTVFFALLLLAVPLLLQLLGLDFAKYVSLYPLYSWSATN